MRSASLGVSRRRVEPGADRGAAHADLQEHLLHGLQRLHFIRERLGKGIEFLPEGHGHGVLQLRPPHLDDLSELLAFRAQRRDELVELGDDVRVAERHADVHGRGIGVVGRLRTVHVVMRITVLVFTFPVAHELERAVRDDLVRVHVRGRAGAALEHVELELIVQLAVDQLLTCSLDAFQHLVRQSAGVVVGARGRELHHCQSFDEVRVEPQLHARDLEVVERARRLDAIVRVSGHREVAKEIVFDPRGRGRHSLPLMFKVAGIGFRRRA